MSQDVKELVVASHGEWSVAPVGTAIPDTPTGALDKAFVGLGLISEDGIKFSRGITVQEFKAWQKKSAVRRESTDEEVMASASLEQWNADNFTFAFGGGEVVEVKPGVFKYEFPGGDDSLDERCSVIRWSDKGFDYQLAFERGNVTEQVEVNLKRSDLAQLPIGYKALAGEGDALGVSFVTNDPAFNPAGS
jgi:hypothetical protein